MANDDNLSRTAAEYVAIGQQIIREMRGDEFFERRRKQRNSFNSVLQDYSDGVCFGQIWSRPGLDRKQRALIVLPLLVALNRPVQLKNHLTGALRLGFTADEIREVMLQTAMYVGLPAAVEGFKVAEEVLKEANLLK